MIDKRSTNGVIRTAVNVSAVRTFAVRLFVQLKRCIWTDIFDVFYKKNCPISQTKRHKYRILYTVSLGFIAAGIVGIAVSITLATDRMILLVAILLVLQIGQRWGVGQLYRR